MKVNVGRAWFAPPWAPVIAQRQGYREDEARTLGKTHRRPDATVKTKRPRFAQESSTPGRSETRSERAEAGTTLVSLRGKAVLCMETPNGLRTLSSRKPHKDPAPARNVLDSAFGDALIRIGQSPATLAATRSPEDLGRQAIGSSASCWVERGRRSRSRGAGPPESGRSAKVEQGVTLCRARRRVASS